MRGSNNNNNNGADIINKVIIYTCRYREIEKKRSQIQAPPTYNAELPKFSFVLHSDNALFFYLYVFQIKFYFVKDG